MANEEKELFKFVNDPKYREKIVEKVHKEQDNQYNKRIRLLEKEKSKLEKLRVKEIRRITDSRWTKEANGKLLVNRTEGKIRINQTEAFFSSIQGAELNLQTGSRIITTEQSKSKKHGSLGGAVVGGLIAGPAGVIVGGVGLGKTKTKGSTVSNQIPTCIHLGVKVNIDGFISEIVLISNQVDQSSITFTTAQSQAQTIIAQLGALAKTAVPKSFLLPEEENSVKSIDMQINSKEVELQNAIADKPTYKLPEIYRTIEQKEMSDQDYLNYLVSTDNVRLAEREENEARFRQQQVAQKGELKQQRRENSQQLILDDNVSRAKKVGSVIISIILWLVSLFCLLFMLVAFVSSGATSGFLFLISASLVNPVIIKVIKGKLIKFPFWMYIIFFVGSFVFFLAGIITFPTDADNAAADNKVTTSSISTEKVKEVEKTEEVENSIMFESENLTENPDSSFAKLSDEQFATLTSLIAKCYYSFALSDEDCVILEDDEALNQSMCDTLDYAYEHNYVMNPDYQAIFATKHDVVTAIPNYTDLQEKFQLDYYFDNEQGEWIYHITPYTINGDDVIEQAGEKYIDAEGYLAPGVVVYWEEDGKLEAAGEIKEISNNQEINKVQYAYAINVDFYDVPEDSGWRDGESFLRTNKELSGKPLYYVNILDENRSIAKEEIDYEGLVNWVMLGNTNPEIGMEVYWGKNGAKVKQFTISAFDKATDRMIVEYDSGNMELKSYKAIMSSSDLYIKGE